MNNQQTTVTITEVGGDTRVQIDPPNTSTKVVAGLLLETLLGEAIRSGTPRNRFADSLRAYAQAIEAMTDQEYAAAHVPALH
jgi:hypothetical protein